MAKQVTLELPDLLYARAQELAYQQKQGITEVITDLLNEALIVGEQTVGETKPDPTVQREVNAYLEMHPRLIRDYLGKYVAIFQGKLVDQDTNFSTLMRRIEVQYPTDFVLVKKVENEPIRTITVRSPRYILGE